MPAVNPDHIQPASLDLRLGDMAHRVRASFLPGPNSTVEAKIKDLRMARIDLTGAPVLERDCVYIIPLLEELSLPENISGKANPRARPAASTFHAPDHRLWHRVRRRARWIQGQAIRRSRFPTFTIALRAGMRLSQLRFVQGSPRAGTARSKGWIRKNHWSIWTRKIARLKRAFTGV